MTAALEDSAAYINRVEDLIAALAAARVGLPAELRREAEQVIRSGAAVRRSIQEARAELARLQRDGQRRLDD